MYSTQTRWSSVANQTDRHGCHVTSVCADDNVGSNTLTGADTPLDYSDCPKIGA
ncbi:hypothetical protein J6590_046114 [Homalodisca vitripennis]|nr:hypothetical protein J6590_046114 [Homalodisca vitripennis]